MRASEGGGNCDLYVPLPLFFNLTQKSQQRIVTQMLCSRILFNQLSPIFTSCLSASPIYAVHLGLIDLVSFKLQLSMGKKKKKGSRGKPQQERTDLIKDF